jgi:hypothetical protein
MSPAHALATNFDESLPATIPLLRSNSSNGTGAASAQLAVSLTSSVTSLAMPTQSANPCSDSEPFSHDGRAEHLASKKLEEHLASLLVSLEANRQPLQIRLWADDVLSELGHDPRSAYVERFWLGLLGPAAAWFLRCTAYGLENAPAGYGLVPHDFAQLIGLGTKTGRQSPFVRSVARLCYFQLAYVANNTLVVRTAIPWLDQRQLLRTPTFLQREHKAWERMEREQDPLQASRRRAATKALTAARDGSSTRDVESLIQRSDLHPTITAAIADWATTQVQIVRYAAGS